jgi:hypothetical protein
LQREREARFALYHRLYWQPTLAMAFISNQYNDFDLFLTKLSLQDAKGNSLRHIYCKRRHTPRPQIATKLPPIPLANNFEDEAIFGISSMSLL